MSEEILELFEIIDENNMLYFLLFALIVELIFTLLLYISNRKKRNHDFERIYTELLDHYNAKNNGNSYWAVLNNGDLPKVIHRESMRYNFHDDELLRLVNRLYGAQKNMQEEFEKMNYLLSSTGVYNGITTSQQGIDAVKLLEQISDMTNIDYLLNLMKDNTESKYIVINNVISDIAHTIRTKLSGINAILLILEGEVTDEKTLDYLKSIEECVTQIEENIQAYQNLMTHSLDENKGSSLSFTEKLSARLKVAVLSSNKRLYIDCLNVENIVMDRKVSHLILLALDCIIENAAFFANDNSTIRVTGKTEGEYYIFQIENDGQIICKDNAQKIFENGFSTHSSSGKGLFFVKSVIQDHLGGAIDYENIEEPVSGVRFIVLLDKAKLEVNREEEDYHGQSITFRK